MTEIIVSCKICETEFSYEKVGGGRLRRFCSETCWQENHDRQGAKWRRENADRARVISAKSNAKNKNATHLRRQQVVGHTKCLECAVIFPIRVGRKDQLFCGSRCAGIYGTRRIAEEARLRNTRQCERCGSDFLPHKPGSMQRLTGAVQRFCSVECVRGAAPERRKVPRHYNLQARKVEAVDPIRVFARDGWKCQLCGVRTPRRLRGTSEPTAPELDHIIPLAKGGEHSYRNVQCACRSCNSSKGSRALGQLRLF